MVSGVEGLIPLASTVTAALPVADYYQGLFDQAGNIVDGLAEIAEATGLFYSIRTLLLHSCFYLKRFNIYITIKKVLYVRFCTPAQNAGGFTCFEHNTDNNKFQICFLYYQVVQAGKV